VQDRTGYERSSAPWTCTVAPTRSRHGGSADAEEPSVSSHAPALDHNIGSSGTHCGLGAGRSRRDERASLRGGGTNGTACRRETRATSASAE